MTLLLIARLPLYLTCPSFAQPGPVTEYLGRPPLDDGNLRYRLLVISAPPPSERQKDTGDEASR